MTRPLTTNLGEQDKRPYFLWDEDLTVGEVRGILGSGTTDEKITLMAHVMREARDDEVWHFTTVDEVLSHWHALAPRLGRRRDFWEFLFDAWRRQGFIS